MRIDGLPNLQKVSQPKSRDAAAKPRARTKRADDSVEISRPAQEAAELAQALKTAPQKANPRLGEIRQRVQSGFYDTEETRRQIAGALLDANSIRPVAEAAVEVRTARRQLDAVPEVRADRVADSRQRVASGFYDQPEVRQQTAANIVDASA